MTDKEVQQKLIDLISLDNYVLSVSEASEKLNISPRQVEANMLYLVQNKFADIWCNMRGLEGISRNLHTLSFCAYPDQTSQHTIINVYGNQNVVAGNEITMRDSNNVQDTSTDHAPKIQASSNNPMPKEEIKSLFDVV